MQINDLNIANTYLLPVIDNVLCNKCNKCIEACPYNVISEKDNFSCSKCIKYCLIMDVPCTPDSYFFNYNLCDSCGLCVEKCPNKAISWFTAK